MMSSLRAAIPSATWRWVPERVQGESEPGHAGRRIVLVVPENATGTKNGAGQRTHALHQALSAIATVDVLVLSREEFRDVEVPDFPGSGKTKTVYLATRPYPKTRASRILSRCWRMLFLSADYGAKREYVGALENFAGANTDLVVFRYFRSYAQTEGKNAAFASRPAIIDFDDRDDQRLSAAANAALWSPITLKWFNFLVVSRVKKLAIKGAEIASHSWFAAHEDITDLPQKKISILPNIPFAPPAVGKDLPQSSPQNILFVGTATHSPNAEGVRWFLRYCWPKIHAECPGARFDICGRGGWAWIREEFPDLGGLHIAGEIDCLEKYYFQSRLAISPIFDGGGSKIKVLEACAYSRAIVATHHSVRGFGSELQSKIPTSENPEEFSRHCTNFLKNEAAARNLGSDLRSIQEKHFTFEAVRRQVNKDVSAILGLSFDSPKSCDRSRGVRHDASAIAM